MVCGCICLSFLSKAQLRTTALSAADKAAIIHIFKGTDPSLHSLLFNEGREVYGKKSISKTDLDYIKKQRFPAGEGAIIINLRGRMAIYFKDESLIYVSATPAIINKNEILDFLLYPRILNLIGILKKYRDDASILGNPNLIDNPDI